MPVGYELVKLPHSTLLEYFKAELSLSEEVFSRFSFFIVCRDFSFFSSCVYVSDQASVIVVCKLNNNGRGRERGRGESRSPSLIIIIAARLSVLSRQVYSILFLFDSQYASHRKCSNEFFLKDFLKRPHLS